MALGDERRTSGRAMEAQRRGADIVRDLQSLSGPTRLRRTLAAIAPVGALATKRGRAYWKPPATGGRGIASPLAEPDGSPREYWSTGIKSTDGLFMLPAIKILNLIDANGDSVQVQLADPS